MIGTNARVTAALETYRKHCGDMGDWPAMAVVLRNDVEAHRQGETPRLAAFHTAIMRELNLPLDGDMDPNMSARIMLATAEIRKLRAKSAAPVPPNDAELIDEQQALNEENAILRAREREGRERLRALISLVGELFVMMGREP